MGLIRAGIGAMGGTLADQWKEFFYCDSMGKNVLVTKGQKRTSGRSSNTKGNDNIISNGSGIAVADGQCMMIVEQGKIVEFCAESGEFTYDTSTEPSIFSGNLGDSVKKTFQVIGKRFAYGGDTGKDQRVYYINTKEMGEILYGTATPVPFRVIVNEELGYKLSVDIRCNGNFTYRICDPLLFYTNVCGNVEQDYESSEISGRLKGELMTALQPALSTLSAKKVQYYEIPAHTQDLSDALNEVLSKTWKEKRGIEVFSFNDHQSDNSGSPPCWRTDRRDEGGCRKQRRSNDRIHGNGNGNECRRNGRHECPEPVCNGSAAATGSTGTTAAGSSTAGSTGTAAG